MTNMLFDKNLLTIRLGKTYELGNYTLGDELGKLVNDIIWVDYSIETKHNIVYLSNFIGYTTKYICVLIDDVLGNKCIMILSRNPPNDKKRRNCKNIKRNK
jgi:hypothetical protein